MKAFALGLALLLAACGALGATKIDGSSQAAYKRSLAALRTEMPAAERGPFEAALQLMTASAFAKSDSRAEMERRMRADLDGKTAGEIIAEASQQRRDVTNAALDGIFKLKKKVRAQLDELDDGKGDAK